MKIAEAVRRAKEWQEGLRLGQWREHMESRGTLYFELTLSTFLDYVRKIEADLQRKREFIEKNKKYVEALHILAKEVSK